MAEARCERVRMWRWRRSPLRRRCDLVEAWVVLAGWVIALVCGVVAGLAAVGAVLGILMIAVQGRSRHTPIPFGPYLAAAGWIALLWGERIVAAYARFLAA